MVNEIRLLFPIEHFLKNRSGRRLDNSHVLCKVEILLFLPHISIMKLMFCQIFFFYREIKYMAGKIQLASCHKIILNCVILKKAICLITALYLFTFWIGDRNQKEMVVTGNRNKKLEVLTVSTFLWPLPRRRKSTTLPL